MALRITYLDGPRAGETLAFGDDVTEIVIGRDPQRAHVVYPPDDVRVSAEHCTLMRESGIYKLLIAARKPVLVDGERAVHDLDVELPESCELQLGDRNGPRLHIERPTLANALPETVIYETAEAVLPVARRALGWRRMALAALLLLVVALGGGGYVYWSTVTPLQERQATLQQQLTQARKTQPVAAEVLQRVKQSVYLVLTVDGEGRESAFGTAWVGAPGRLVTNAHVADAFRQLPQGRKMIVRASSEPWTTLEVTSVAIHPGFEAFSRAWNEYKPVRLGNDGEVSILEPPGSAYDVASIQVDHPEKLAAPLPIAPRDVLLQLTTGSQVAYAGFPMEQMAQQGVNPARPEPTVQNGIVSAVSDYFLLPRGAEDNVFIRHTLPIAGGASGSPIVDAEGRVVAVLSGGNHTFFLGERSPSAVNINFAQRADLVTELLDGHADQALAAREANWQDGFRLLSRFDELAEKEILKNWHAELPSLPGEPEKLIDRQGRIEKMLDRYEVFAAPESIDLKDSGQYLIYAASTDRTDTDLYLLSEREQIITQDEAFNWFSVVTFKAERPRKLLLLVVSPEKKPVDYQVRVYRLPLTAPGTPSPPAKAEKTGGP